MHWYRSKVDWWLVPLLAAPPIAAVIMAGVALRSGEPLQLAWGFGALLFVAGLYLGVVYPIRYGIDDLHLVIRNGLMRQRIPLADIVEVRPTRNPLSSPAMSLDRLRIQYGAGLFKSVMISPNERPQFLEHLARTVGLTESDGGLIPPARLST
jgi:hypothetical protein